MRLPLTSASVAAGCAAYASNERIVSHRAARLERLRAPCNHCDMQNEKIGRDQLANFRRPIIVEDLLDEWPASNTRRWSLLRAARSHRPRAGRLRLVDGRALLPRRRQRGALGGRRPRALRLRLGLLGGQRQGRAAARRLWPASSRAATSSTRARRRTTAIGRWRWLLAGPANRHLHASDPWSYSSWNASLVGSKRWVLFPPDVSRETLHPPRTDLLARRARRHRAAAARRRLHGRDSASAARLRTRRG